jgi:cytochrome P450
MRGVTAEGQAFEAYGGAWGPIALAEMARLRRDDPVARMGSGMFYLARYAECRRALGDSRAFSNRGGLRAPGVVIPRDERMINEMDPPDHTRMRKLEQSCLNQAHFRALEPWIRELARQSLERLEPGDTAELRAALCDPIPARVASRIIGVPEADHAQFALWSREVCSSPWITENRTPRGEGLSGGHPEFASYIDSIVRARRRAADPPDDLVTRLVSSEEDGRRLGDTEIRIALAHLIIAGNDTTSHLLANLLHRLIADPELYAHVRAEPERLPAAIEESLRFDAVVQLLTRTAAVDVELAGVKIPAGTRVVVGMASANRDESVFGADADVFRIDRADPPMHLTFGYGPHLCLGANLARLEARIVVEAFLERFAAPALAPGWRFERLPAYWEFAPRTLEVRLAG